MLYVLQVASMLVVLASTFLIFKSFGPRREFLLYTAEEKKEWDKAIGGDVGAWLTISNIFGTLMSVATVYVFFMGSAKLFGGFSLACVVSILFGAFVTNVVTKKICKNKKVCDLLESGGRAGGVIASIFWRDDQSSRKLSGIVKYISIANILGVIWLDFTVFTDISSAILNINNVLLQCAVLFAVCYVIFYFVIRYGLRGFVFADLFQSPLVGLASVAMVLGVVLLFVLGESVDFSVQKMLSPYLSLEQCGIFVAHVILVNSMLVVVTEPHWLRVWLFGQRETQLQFKSTAITAFVWLLLIIVGLFAAFVIPNKHGEVLIVSFLGMLSDVSYVFLILFWMGSTAALFASVDVQIFSLILVNDFSADSGQIIQRRIKSISPSCVALIVSTCFVVVYFVVRSLNVPIEKIIFIVIPFSFNIMPSLLLLAFGKRQNYRYTCYSLALYVLCAAVGLHQRDSEMLWTLLAALVPFVVSCIALVLQPASDEEYHNG